MAFSLKKYNTFGINAETNFFFSVNESNQIKPYLPLLQDSAPPVILGGGSNVLFIEAPESGVLHINIGGIHAHSETDTNVLVTAGAGVEWTSLVEWALKHNLGGIENLILIPGRCGAAPMQNIGAYGIELESVFHSLKGWLIPESRMVTFSRDECRFGYRESIFKHELRHQVVITEITLQLSKPGHHTVNTSYAPVLDALRLSDIQSPSIQDVGRVVRDIRMRKLPDWRAYGNAGSFFKNPVISDAHFNQLKAEWTDIPGYPLPDSRVKVPAAWLIDQAGWKNRRTGKAGSWKNQALVIVNYGGASGQEILTHARSIRDDVLSKFGVELKPEVNLVGLSKDEQF
ncbi:MAG: UDP-N-acetylmuramate dehydrogenase [Balneolales bacterium]|nr:UDP-N-acetylmuramate dehydrogenase [Balneolales bacterium]